MANHSPRLTLILESDILSENATNHDKVLDNKAKKGRFLILKNYFITVFLPLIM